MDFCRMGSRCGDDACPLRPQTAGHDRRVAGYGTGTFHPSVLAVGCNFRAGSFGGQDSVGDWGGLSEHFGIQQALVLAFAFTTAFHLFVWWIWAVDAPDDFLMSLGELSGRF